jgi:hypothetical protein
MGEVGLAALLENNKDVPLYETIIINNGSAMDRNEIDRDRLSSSFRFATRNNDVQITRAKIGSFLRNQQNFLTSRDAS